MLEEKEKNLRKLLSNKNGIDFISKRLSHIIKDKDFYRLGLMEEIVEKLIENGYGNIIINNFPLLIEESIEDESMFIIKRVAKLEKGKKVLSDNLDYIYSKLDGEDIPELIELLDDEEKKKIQDRNCYAYDLYNKELIGENSLGSIIKSDMSIFIEAVIKEVSEGRELTKLDSGTYSDVIKTNGYVIKIGETREKFEIPYHPNILQPLLREKITDQDGKCILVVEVQNVVDTKNVTEEQRKKLKCKLKEAKISYNDIEEDNVGILIKPNERKLYGGVGGIIDYDDIKETTLEPGEPVLLDTDLIEREREN